MSFSIFRQFLTNDPSLRYSIVPNWHVFKLMGGVGSLPKRAEYVQSLIQANPLKKTARFSIEAHTWLLLTGTPRDLIFGKK